MCFLFFIPKTGYSRVKFNGKWIIYRRFLHYPVLLSLIFHIILLVFFVFGIITFILKGVLCPFKIEVKDKNADMCNNYYTKMAKIIFGKVYKELFCLVLTDLLLFSFYKILMWIQLKSVKSESKLNMERISFLSKRRTTYLNINTLYKTFYSDEFNEIRTSRRIAEDAGLYISKLLFEEHPDVLSGLNHPNIYINPLEGVFTRYHIYYDLKTLMFQKTWEKMPGNLPPLTDIVIYIKDILNGVQYLHDHQIKHLNICPENILVMECPYRESGIAKILGFDFAVKTDQRIVDHQKVGLEWTYR